MQKKRTGRMLCSLALSAVTLWGVSVTAPAKNARDALRSLKDETLGVMLLRYERGDRGEDFLSLRTSLALHATPLLRDNLLPVCSQRYAREHDLIENPEALRNCELIHEHPEAANTPFYAGWEIWANWAS